MFPLDIKLRTPEMKRVFFLIALGIFVPFMTHAAEKKPEAVMNARHRALLQSNCEGCHGSEKQKGKFRVDDLPFKISDLATAERWQKILNAMNSGEMPPEEEKKQPSKAAKTDFLDDLSNVMVAARRNLSDQNGLITMRRLNRREYRNTLRELLGVEINVSDLPPDNAAGGFDTAGANLFMSANQFEQYQMLGRKVLDEAFEWQASAGVQKKFHLEAEDTLKTITKKYNENLDALERAKQWVKAVEDAAARAENAAIVEEIRKASKDDATFRRSWAKITGAPAPEEFGFKTVENNADKANGALSYETPIGAGYLRPFHEYYLNLPHLDTGAYLTVMQGEDLNSWLILRVPYGWPPGEYLLRVRVGATPDASPERRFLEFGIHPRSGKVISTHEITGTLENPQVIEIPLTLTREHMDPKNGDDKQLFIREKGTADHFIRTREIFGKAKTQNKIGPTVALWVDWMEIERVPNAEKPPAPGLAALKIPLDDKSPATSAEELRDAIQRFATTVFRGSVPSPAYLDKALGLYNTRRQAGDKHSAALKETLSIVLASPMFLYLAEPSFDEKRRPLTGLELAARLSYFLWSAPPDAELRDLGSRGELSKPAVLAAQTDRLLNDPRSSAFTRAFVTQWLGLERLDFFELSLLAYPRFDYSTKLAAKNEVFETFSHLLRENASLRDLLKSDYVVINSVLAQYYGIDHVHGDAFRKVALPKDSVRGGLLGMAAVSLMGGNGDKTSPVERGAWVLRKLLNDPPPPAPANIPAITRLAGKPLTIRERLQSHQEDAQCASCHRKIDPIGFGLENLNAVGEWRTEDSYQVLDDKGKPDPKLKKTWQIDPAGAFYKGAGFKDYFELRDAIAEKSEAFTKGFSTALLEYGLGRSCGFRDEPLVSEMLKKAKQENFAIREMFQTLVASQEFHTK